MKTLLYLLIFSMSLSVGPINADPEDKNKFCSSKDESVNVSRAFIIQNQIYFGDEMSYQTVNIGNDFDISRKHTFKEIFGETIIFTTLISGVHFPRIECDESKGTDCDDLKKATDLVLIIGTVGTKYGFKAYRAYPGGDPTAIDPNAKMPWQLKIEAMLEGGSFWEIGTDQYLAFTYEDSTTNLYISAKDSNKKDCSLYYHKLENGKFPKEFKMATPPSSRVYTGLVDWKGKLYGLSNNFFYELSVNDIKITEKGEFSAKQFFNCDGNSPLKDDALKRIPPDQNGTHGDQNSTGDGNETEITTESITEIIAETGITPEPQTSATLEPESKSNNWIIYVIIIIVIIIIIIVIICCLFCCKKAEQKDPSKDKEAIKSAPDSKIISEGGSKIPSKTGSKADKTVGEGSSGGPKGVSGTASGEGSGGAKGTTKEGSGGLKKSSLSMKSTDSTASLRSSKISNI